MVSGSKAVEELIPIVKGSNELKFLLLDVVDEDSLREARETFKKHFPDDKLWALINNAGTAAKGDAFNTQSMYLF